MNPFTFQPSLAFLQSSGYLVIFILMIVEGPLITYFAAFAASLGIFNIYIIFWLSLIGNFLSDLIFFSIGKFGNRIFLYKYLSRPKHKFLVRLKYHLEENTLRALSIMKIILPLAAPGIVILGTSKVSFRKFALLALIMGIPFSLFFTIIGFYSGVAFNSLFEYFKLGEVAILIFLLFFILIWFLYKKLSNPLARKLKKKLRLS